MFRILEVSERMFHVIWEKTSAMNRVIAGGIPIRHMMLFPQNCFVVVKGEFEVSEFPDISKDAFTAERLVRHFGRGVPAGAGLAAGEGERAASGIAGLAMVDVQAKLDAALRVQQEGAERSFVSEPWHEHRTYDKERLDKMRQGVPAAGVEGRAAEDVADQVSARDTEMKRAAESGFFRTEDQMFFRELRTKAIITNMLLQGWDRRKAEERVSHYSQADLLQYEAMSAPVLDVVERYIAKVEAKNGGGIQGSGSVQADVGRRP